MDFDRPKHGASTHGATEHDAPTPGRSSLTQDLAPIQRRADPAPSSGQPATPAEPEHRGPRLTLQMILQRRHGGAPSHDDPDQVHAAAARGTATAAAQLPHLDQVQRSFGHHDVSGVKAHVGADAAASARAMGAHAYATGDHVVLGDRADLHTVAHEAAHVVQQRGGVQLKGGVGAVGDAYEQHADAVADKVVRGESAQALLDQYAGGRPSTAGAGSVQGSIQLLTSEELEELRPYVIERLQASGLGPDDTLVQMIINASRARPTMQAARANVDNLVRLQASRRPRTAPRAQPTAAEASGRDAREAAPVAPEATQSEPSASGPEAEAAPATADAPAAHGPDVEVAPATADPPAAQRPEPEVESVAQDTAAGPTTAVAVAPAAVAPVRRPPKRGLLAALGATPDQLSAAQERNVRQRTEGHVDPQVARQREREAGGAAIAPRLATASLQLTGGRARAHLIGDGDGTAGITEARARQIVQTAAPGDVSWQPTRNSYMIQYDEHGVRGSIVFSTPDRGRTLQIFHIGPGAPQG